MQDRSRSSISDSGNVIWIAAPLALVVTFSLARVLPIRFAGSPNPRGIVSWSTRSGYPVIQEIFWYGFSLSVATVVAWSVARILARRRITAVGQVALEALAALAVVAIVFIGIPAAALVLACVGVLLFVISAPGMPVLAIAATEQGASAPRSRLRGLPLLIGTIGVALLVSPSFWRGVIDVAKTTPDSAFVSTSWNFQAEAGQHLAWANAVLHGQVPGRDFFMLYGPLFPIGAVGTWALFGRSIAAWSLYLASLNLLAVCAAIALAARLITRRGLCLALPLVALPVVVEYWGGLELRYGLALAALACLVRGFEESRDRWSVAAGFLAGVGMMFSQEFALAFLVTAVVVLALRARRGEAIGFVAGTAFGAAPCLLWLAWAEALTPVLQDLSTYPALVMAGFGKLPFPSALRLLPIPLAQFDTERAVGLRMGYAVPAVCWAGLLWAVRIHRFDPRHPIVSLRLLRDELVSDPRRLGVAALACFGLLAFRFALGRSSLQNTNRVCGAAAILLCVGLDRSFDAWRSARPLATWRVAALACVAVLGGFVGVAAPAARQAATRTMRIALDTERPRTPAGNQDVLGVLDWLRGRAGPGDEVLFLPNHAALYYLADRRCPIRFVLSHQHVTQTHRDETLTRLRTTPPRFIVFEPSAWKVDQIPHEDYLGPAIGSWFVDGYRPSTRVGSFEVFERRRGY